MHSLMAIVMSDSSASEEFFHVLAQAPERLDADASDAWAHANEEFSDKDSFSSLNLNRGSKLEDIYQCLDASRGSQLSVELSIDSFTSDHLDLSFGANSTAPTHSTESSNNSVSTTSQPSMLTPLPSQEEDHLPTTVSVLKSCGSSLLMFKQEGRRLELSNFQACWAACTSNRQAMPPPKTP